MSIDALLRPLVALRVAAAFFLSVCVLWPSTGMTDDDEDEIRLALVIGNGAYQNVAPLDNPVNDAELMAGSLEGVGFEVILVTDASRDEMIRAISTFGKRLRDADDDSTGLFYYAGHGVQSFGANFLLPVDVDLLDAADLSLVGVPAQALLRQMFSARNQTNIVILDACRDNPFETIPDLNENGLAEMKAPRGTFLAYSTAPGEVAVDGAGSNSPFTGSLAQRMSAPGVPIEALFKNVRRDVLEATGGLQTPWDTSSLTVNFQFQPAVQPSPEEIQERQLWESVKLSNDPIQLMLYLRANPQSAYAGEARSLLQDLVSQEVQSIASAPQTTPAEPQTASEAAPTVVAAPEPQTSIEAAPAPEAAIAIAPEVVPAPAPKTLPEPEPEPAEAVQNAPVTTRPETAERDLIEAARQSGALQDYQAYLDAYPEGAFAELARLEVATIEQNGQRTDPIADAPVPAPMTAVEEKPSGALPDVIAFNAPLGAGGPDIASKSIADLIVSFPKFPPIEGLPEDVWKNKTCASCHQWEQANLCDQAQTYVADRTRALSKDHPFGGVFKNALRVWAQGGCE